MGALPKPTLPPGPVATLFDRLHEAHRRAGWPSLRDMSREVGCSHTTVSVAFSEPRLPRWGLLELIVETLGGDVEEFHRLWLAASSTGTDAPADPRRTPPRDLPAGVVAFTGRTSELALLDATLQPSVDPSAVPIAVVCGTAGVGKTALAVQWAHRVTSRFPDGQLYVNLRGYDPDRPMLPGEALETILRELGVDGAAVPREQPQRASLYRTLLAGQRVLVVLDNANSVEQVRDLLPGTSSCAVIITSRDTLSGLVARHGARRVSLDLLRDDDAYALLCALAQDRVVAEPDAARELAVRCARLPLALRIAAELATAREGTTLSELVAELGAETRRLELFDTGDDEHTALSTVFSWSHRQLADDTARAFRLLGCNPGPDCSLPAAAALFGVAAPDARRLLERLARVHLVELRTGRCGMHDLLRAYAADLAAAAPAGEREEAVRRLFEYYVQAAESADDRRWLDAERVNLLAIAAQPGQPALTVRLASALADYLDGRAYYADALTLDQLALDAARAAGDRVGEGTALNLLGAASRRVLRYREAEEFHSQALQLHRAVGHRPGEGLALLGLGVLYSRSGRYADAGRLLDEAMAIFAEFGDRVSEGHALYVQGTIALKSGHYDDSLVYLQRALQVNRAIGERTGEGRSLNNLGEVYRRLGRLDEAGEMYEQALAVAREVGNRAGEAVALTNLGAVAAEQGRHDDALELHWQALAICQQVGYRMGEADALLGIGYAYSRLGRHDEALTHLRQAADIGRDGGGADVQTGALNALGDVLRAMGRGDDAAVEYGAALELAMRTGDPYERQRAQDGLAGCASAARAGSGSA